MPYLILQYRAGIGTIPVENIFDGEYETTGENTPIDVPASSGLTFTNGIIDKSFRGTYSYSSENVFNSTIITLFTFSGIGEVSPNMIGFNNTVDTTFRNDPPLQQTLGINFGR